MGNKTFFNKLINFIKNNKVSVIVILSGIFLYMLSVLLRWQSGFEIPSYVRLIRYAGALLFLSGLFIFLVKNNKTILANLVLVLNLIVILEIVCFFLLGLPVEQKKYFKLPVLPNDHIASHIGTVPYGDSIYHSVLIKENDTVFDVNYTIDHQNKRVTPGHDSKKEKFALFFGCSIAFGEGLLDDETLPYYFQEESEEYNSYNFAYSGYGTNHMLARLEYENLSEKIPENDGSAFYIFFWDHIYRTIGSMNRYTDWLMNAPYYTYDEGRIVRKKMFKDGRYFVSKFYQLVYNTAIVKYFEIDFPGKLKNHHIEYVCDIISKSRDVYKEQFGNDDFYVVIYPSFVTWSPEEIQMFRSFLEEKQVGYIDLSEYIEYSGKYTLGGDPHPNANTSKLIAKELLRRFKNNEIILK